MLVLAVKALLGGLFVTGFAVLAEGLSPKRLAGVFSAAPSVALGSLVVTLATKGSASGRAEVAGMVLGAAAFAVFCLVALRAVPRLGAVKGSAVGLVAWCLTVAPFVPLLRSLPVAR